VTAKTGIGHRRRTIRGNVSRRRSVTLSGSLPPALGAPLATVMSDTADRPRAIVASTSHGTRF
jgi:hypothetical protein